MTHAGPMPDSAGDFGPWESPMDMTCPECGQDGVNFRRWESHCGGYEDRQYRCFSCEHTWWVDGPDS
jgi:DNA-directed RNA polymerase subunit M/transcription elongation factor TFIIS